MTAGIYNVALCLLSMLNNAVQSVSHQLPPTSGVTLKMLELSPVMVFVVQVLSCVV